MIKLKKYYYNSSNNEPIGPLTLEKLCDLYDAGQLSRHTWIIEKGGNDWRKLDELLSERLAVTQRTAMSSIGSSAHSSTSVLLPRPPFVAAEPRAFDRPRAFTPATRPAQPAPPITHAFYDPLKLKAIAFTSLISGVANIFIGLSWISAGLIFSLVSVLVAIIPAAYCLAVGIGDIVYASKILNAKPQTISPTRSLAVLDMFSVVMGNVVSGCLGIINLLLHADNEVKDFFIQRDA